MTTPRVLLSAAQGDLPGRGGRRVSVGAMAVAVMLGLAGCGGGGDGDEVAAPGAAPVPGAAPTPGPAPAPGAAPAPVPATAPVPSPVPAPGPAPTPTPPSGPPIARASCEAFPVVGAAPVSGSLAGKASSPSGGSLTYSVVTQPQSGTVSLVSNGGFTYTRFSPARGDVDSFVYRVTDSAGLTAEATAQLIYGKRRIMPLGDSITEGVVSSLGASTLPADNLRIGYRMALRDRLGDAGYAVEFVGNETSGGSVPGFADDARHEGHSGATQLILTNGVAGWLAASPPDVVLLHIGTNDVASNSDVTAAQTFNLLETIERWTQNGLNPPVRLTLATIIGQRDVAANNRVAAFNNNLGTQYAQSWTTPRARFDVDLLDMNSELAIPADLSDGAIDNGLHPNEGGYKKMADAWFEALVANQAIHKCP